MYEMLPLKTSQARLLQVIWHLNGGPHAVADIIGIARQLPINWRVRGRVPLKMVGLVSRKLGVPPAVLNIEDVIRYTGKVFIWKSQVDKLGLSRQDYHYVMNARMPKKAKELLACEA